MKVITIDSREGLEQLRQKSLLIPENLIKGYNTLCDGMKRFVENNKNGACGLAAVQVGVPVRIIAVKTPSRPGSRAKTRIFINPEYAQQEAPGMINSPEKCLSEPGVEISVPRMRTVRIRYNSREGKLMEFYAQGIVARIIQHELDHLEGKLLIDYANKEETKV